MPNQEAFFWNPPTESTNAMAVSALRLARCCSTEVVFWPLSLLLKALCGTTPVGLCRIRAPEKKKSSSSWAVAVRVYSIEKAVIPHRFPKKNLSRPPAEYNLMKNWLFGWALQLKHWLVEVRRPGSGWPEPLFFGTVPQGLICVNKIWYYIIICFIH